MIDNFVPLGNLYSNYNEYEQIVITVCIYIYNVNCGGPKMPTVGEFGTC